MRKIFLFCASAIALLACGEQGDNPIPEPEQGNKTDWYAAADSSVNALTHLFWNGSYFNYGSDGNQAFHYWPQAHALDVWIDAYQRTNNEVYKTYFDLWLKGVKKGNGGSFKNDFYDDMEWNALAILRAYQATGNPQYKEAALQIWEQIQTGWNENAGGGISWKRGMEYSKNACSNGPACILAARLYQAFGDGSYKNWAIKIYEWEKNNLFNKNNGMVYDHIDSRTGEIKKEWIFTYNQGTFIGSAVELHRILNEKSYLNDATLAADYTISNLVSNSVLKDEGNGDGGLFKGIFVRYLTELTRQKRLDPTAKKRYLQFLRYNAETLWGQGTDKSNVLFGTDWRKKPTGQTGLTEQLSGCMLIEAVALLDSEQSL